MCVRVWPGVCMGATLCACGYETAMWGAGLVRACPVPGAHLVHTKTFRLSLLLHLGSSRVQGLTMRPFSSSLGQEAKGLTNPPPLTEVDALVDCKYAWIASSNCHKVTYLFQVVYDFEVLFHWTRKSVRRFFLLHPMVLWSKIFSTSWSNCFMTKGGARFVCTLFVSGSS